MNGIKNGLPKLALSADQFALCCNSCLTSHPATTVHYTLRNLCFCLFEASPKEMWTSCKHDPCISGSISRSQPRLSGDLILRLRGSSDRECGYGTAVFPQFCGLLPVSIFRSCSPSLPPSSRSLPLPWILSG